MDVLGYVLNEFNSLTKKPQNYLSVQDDIAKEVSGITKSLYDFTKLHESNTDNASALPELIIQDFDEEQIWQEIELQNNSVWSHFLKNVSFCVAGKNNLHFPFDIVKSNSPDQEPNIVSGVSHENDPIAQDTAPNKSRTKARKIKKKREVFKSSIVDDEFFKLNDLEQFLNSEDKKETKSPKSKKAKYDDSSGDEEESIDYFQDMESDVMEDSNDVEDHAKYKDFFDNPYDNETKFDDNEYDEENAENSSYGHDDIDDVDGSDIEDNDDIEPDIADLALDDNKLKKVRFASNEDSTSADSESDEDGKHSAPKPNDNQLSSFELRQERLKRKIGHLEQNLLSEKPWQMKGEVDANKRPQNSLLEEIVDFDLTSRPAPVITEETTLRLEDIIIQRVKDKAWDDVERKEKPTKDHTEFRKAIVLDQEKSKLSLAQVYEQEFVKQREALNPDDERPEEESKEHKEIREMMRSLLSKLNALSNYHYTPKPAVPEVRIISNIPAINMEEVAPVATSDAALLAPEEVKTRPKGNVIGQSERTDTDKKRERRKKKLRLKEKEKQRQIRENEKAKSQQSTSGSKKRMNTKEKERILKSVTKARNVYVAKPDKQMSAKSFKL